MSMLPELVSEAGGAVSRLQLFPLLTSDASTRKFYFQHPGISAPMWGLVGWGVGPDEM